MGHERGGGRHDLARLDRVHLGVQQRGYGQLYMLADDPGEEKNIAAPHPEKVELLTRTDIVLNGSDHFRSFAEE